MTPLQSILTTYRAFEKAGRDLAHWHLDYETVECFPGGTVAMSKEEGPYCPSLPAQKTGQ